MSETVRFHTTPRRDGLVQSRHLMAETTKQALLRKAAGLMGEGELAAHLKVSHSLLENWISGDATMPDGMLLKLAKVLDAWRDAHKSKK
jgi:DNA-binding transcriptional regulator YiaG